MIAKILKHSKSFAGIEYNRLKTENGKAEMLEAKNFELEAMVGLTGQPSAATYLDFLNYVSDRRPDVNYRQFHAVISCAGRELSKEQLLDAARIYIDKMGYGDQPYLVFFHKDTDNNHVHIVSTRVRYDGSLVSDKSERYRSLAAIREKKRIALANKETLVCAGELVMAEAERCGADIVPVDSEHSAIFQSLQGCRDRNEVRRLLLTCSGGPFFGRTYQQLESVTPADALKHPNWSMGAKITIDSATLMNKGLEVIEAMRLYRLPVEKVDVELIKFAFFNCFVILGI